MFSLKDKVIVVTGGNGFLGKRIISNLWAAGAVAISADVHFDEVSEHDLHMDISNEASVRNQVKYVIDRYGRIDGWVNNAYPRTSDWGDTFEDFNFSSWRKNVDMHMNGYCLCCQVVLERMKDWGGGSLINMASIYGMLGPDFTVYEGTNMTNPAAYAAIKGGIINLTRYLASYYGPAGVRVNSISPGGIWDNQYPQFVAQYNKKVPLNRMGTPEDIAPAVVFLQSNEAAYITGHNLVIDGGWSIV